MSTEYDPEQWEERQDASFRGVPFYVVSVKGKSGRRALPREYPKRDGGWTEDNGGVLNNEVIQAELVGVNAEAEFADLMNALNVAGPGELVHPYWGVQQVQVGSVDYDFDNDERHIARLSFEVYAAGENLFANYSQDTSAETAEKAQASDDANVAQYEEELAEMDSEEEQTMLDTVDGVLEDLDNFINNLPGLPEEIGEWMDRVEHAKWAVGRLLAYPGELAREVINLVTDIKDLVTELPQSLNVYSQMSNRWKGLMTELTYEPTVDEASAKKAAVKKATYNMSYAAAVVAKTKAIAKAPAAGEEGGFSDSAQASDTATTVSDELQELAEQAVESGNREGWRAFRKLRVAVANDLSERIHQLPDVKVVTPTRAIPVALLAYQQTGNTENRDTIIKRNRLSRPSFITVHQSVEVVLPEDSNG